MFKIDTDKTYIFDKIVFLKTFPDWYFSRIGLMQRLPPLSKMKPAISGKSSFVKFEKYFDPPPVNIFCLDVGLVGWLDYSSTDHVTHESTHNQKFCFRISL